MKQLQCRDLAPGDTLLKFAAPSVSNRLIEAAQGFRGMDNAEVSAAGVLFDNVF